MTYPIEEPGSMSMPTLYDIKEYLMFNHCGTTTWTDYQIATTLEAEATAQAVACRVPEPMPEDLAEALRRRVAHNFALQVLATDRSLTLVASAIATAQSGGLDPMVRRLEAPYRRLCVG